MTKKKKTTSAASKDRKTSRSAKSAAKPYTGMTTDELRRATAEFDREYVGDSFGPPTAKQRVRLVRAKSRFVKP